MNMDYIRRYFDKLKTGMIGTLDSGNVRTENSDGCLQSLVGFIQVFSDKIAATLNSKHLVAYAQHPSFLNVSSRRKQQFIDIGHTLVRLKTVCST